MLTKAFTGRIGMVVPRDQLSLNQLGEIEKSTGKTSLWPEQPVSDDKFKDVTIGQLFNCNKGSLIAVRLSEEFPLTTVVKVAKLGQILIIRLKRREYAVKGSQYDFRHLPVK